jgi:hypothetical protein
MRQKRHIENYDEDDPVAGTWGIWGGWTPTGRESVLHRGDEGYPLTDVGDTRWLWRMVRDGLNDDPVLADVQREFAELGVGEPLTVG